MVIKYVFYEIVYLSSFLCLRWNTNRRLLTLSSNIDLRWAGRFFRRYFLFLTTFFQKLLGLLSMRRRSQSITFDSEILLKEFGLFRIFAGNMALSGMPININKRYSSYARVKYNYEIKSILLTIIFYLNCCWKHLQPFQIIFEVLIIEVFRDETFVLLHVNHFNIW